MKKFLALGLVMAMGLAVARQSHAIDTSNGRPPAIGAPGGTLQQGSMLLMSNRPATPVCMGPTMIAAVNINQGDALVLVAGQKVSETTTVGDVNFYGFATETVAFGGLVQVARFGTIYANVSATATAGDRLVMSANPGFLTPSTAVTAAQYTSVSGTPIVARALVSYTYVTYSPKLLISIGDKL